MNLRGKADFLRMETFHSEKTGKDYHTLVLNGDNGEFKISTDRIYKIDKYKPVDFIVDVLQGKYPRFNLVQIIEEK